DYYAILGVTRSASPASIKSAYHHALLRFHPDKQHPIPQPTHTNPAQKAHTHDIGAIKDAYRTLTTPALRAEYERGRTPTAPRPAQVVSLEDFAEGEGGAWTHGCRCGGVYRIVEAELERGQHLVACGSCSEVVWVGYEVVEEAEDS
ncbi:hypothetical protein FA95DRAFT_1498037, partial [Auriscalpium vulgare]